MLIAVGIYHKLLMHWKNQSMFFSLLRFYGALIASANRYSLLIYFFKVIYVVYMPYIRT